MNVKLNRFTDGLNTDNSPNFQPENTLTEQCNMRVINDKSGNYSLQNINGNEYIDTIKQCDGDGNVILLNNYLVISSCAVSTYAVILSTNGLSFDLSVFDQDTNEIYSVFYGTAFNNLLNYSTKRVRTYAELRSNNKIYVYIANIDNNPSRVIRLQRTSECGGCGTWTLDKEYTPENFETLTRHTLNAKEPIIQLKDYNSTFTYNAGVKNGGGKLACGNWKYSIRYKDKSGNYTRWSVLTNEIPIYVEQYNTLRGLSWNKVWGDDIQRVANKHVELVIENVDFAYSSFDLAAVLTQEFDGVVTEKAYYIKNTIINSMSPVTCTHTGYETTIQEMDITEFSINNVNVFNYKSLQAIDNRLFIANIKESLINDNLQFQKIADKINLEWSSYVIPESEGTFDKGTSCQTIDTTGLVDSPVYITIGGVTYSDPTFLGALALATPALNSYGVSYTNVGVNYTFCVDDYYGGISFTVGDLNQIFFINIGQGAKVGNYKIPYNCFYKLGYYRDERYSFAIQFKLKDGTKTACFPIGKGDLNTQLVTIQTAEQIDGDYVGDAILGTSNLIINAPTADYNTNNIDVCNIADNYAYYVENTYIYRSPQHITNWEILTTDTNYENDSFVKVLYPKFNNIDITGLEDLIDGFYILRADRTNNGQIICQGAAIPCTQDKNTSGGYSTDVQYAPVFYDDFGLYYQNEDSHINVFGLYIPDQIFAKQDYLIDKNCNLTFNYTNFNGQDLPNLGSYTKSYLAKLNDGYFSGYINSNIDIVYNEVNKYKTIQTDFYGQRKFQVESSLNGFTGQTFSVPVWNESQLVATRQNPVIANLFHLQANIVDGGYMGKLIHNCKLIGIHGNEGHLVGMQPLPANADPYYNRTIAGQSLMYLVNVKDDNRIYPAPIFRNYLYTGNYTQTTNQTIYNDISVFGGDCYINKNWIELEIRDLDPLKESNDPTAQASLCSRYISFYSENSNNIALRHARFDENGQIINFGFFPYTVNYDLVLQARQVVFEDEYYQLGYTTDKSAQIQVNATVENNDEILTAYQIRYSELQADADVIDNYRIFLPLNFKDVNKKGGSISDLDSFNEQLIILQEDYFGVVPINQPAQVQSTAGNILLGDGSVIGQKINYYGKETFMGMQHQFAHLSTERGVYFFDAKRRKIFLFNGQMQCLSDTKGIKTTLNRITSKKYLQTDIHTGYDFFNREVLFRFPDVIVTSPPEVVLTFNENMDVFSGFHSYTPQMWITIGDKLYSFNNKQDNTTRLYQHNIGNYGRFYEQIFQSVFEYVVANNKQLTFMFAKYFVDCDPYDRNTRFFKDRIDRIPQYMQCSTTYQYGQKDFINVINVRDVEFARLNGLPVDNIMFKEQHFHTDIPFVYSHDDKGYDFMPPYIDLPIEPTSEYASTERLRDFYCKFRITLDNSDNKRQRYHYIETIISESNI